MDAANNAISLSLVMKRTTATLALTLLLMAAAMASPAAVCCVEQGSGAPASARVSPTDCCGEAAISSCPSCPMTFSSRALPARNFLGTERVVPAGPAPVFIGPVPAVVLADPGSLVTAAGAHRPLLFRLHSQLLI